MNVITQATDAVARYVHAHPSIPDEARSTLPSVVLDAALAQYVVVGYHLGEPRPAGPPRPRMILFPFFEVRVKLSNMETSGRSISGAEFGLSVPPNQYIGDLGELIRFGVKGYMERKDHYTRLLSDIVDHGWLLPHTDRTGPEIACARDLATVLAEIGEKALEPYYRVTMRDIRAWIVTCTPA